jgi:serine/threonine protein kinase
VSVELAIDVAPDAEAEEKPDATDFPPGTVLVERYRILQTLGRGGMGSVYLAEHVEVGRKVAIKVLLPQWSETESIVKRFRAEARTASKIGHPNIVQVFDAGTLPDKRLFLVMEHLEGRDLEAELIEFTSLEVRRACVVMHQIALALGAAHRAGVVHRDLKPSNIMLVPQHGGEAVKVLDFGIAANASVALAGDERITRPGSLMGTPEYMAPEQATNLPARPTFDVYAMGVMLFEMITGDIPLSASNAFELLAFKLNRPAPSLDERCPGLPASLVRLVADCLATDPAERPQDGDAVAARLEVVLQDLGRDAEASVPRRTRATPVEAPAPDLSVIRPRQSPEPTPGTTLVPPPRRERRVSPSTIVLAALALLGIVALVCALRADPPPEPNLAAPAPESPGPEQPDPKDISPPPPAPPTPEPAAPEPETPEPEAPEAEAPAPEPAARSTSARSTSKPTSRSDAHLSARCQRVRASAEEARRSQRWAVLRDYSRQRECWASSVEARKLETKALMELGDFKGCMSVGKGLKDQEAQGWLKLCQKRAGG